MRAEFTLPGEPDGIVGTAEWRDGRVVIEAQDQAARDRLDRVFRVSSVATDESSMRARGTSGLIVGEPGDIEWFRTAALVRGRAEGLDVRLVSQQPGGWDPAMDPQTFGWAGRKPGLLREQ